MDPVTKRLLEELEGMDENLQDVGPIQLDAEYLAMIEQVEAMEQNQDGADKSWVWECLESDRLHFLRARRIH